MCIDVRKSRVAFRQVSVCRTFGLLGLIDKESVGHFRADTA